VTSGFAVSLWSGQRSSRVFSGRSGSGTAKEPMVKTKVLLIDDDA